MDTVTQATRERAWCLYDWGNSAFATICMTAILPPYLSSLAAASSGSSGSAIWGWTAAAGLLLGILFGPPLGALADSRRQRRALLALFAIVGACATAALGLALPASWKLGTVLYVVAATGFAGANIFYDALLPGLAPRERWDELSARGYAYGYVGGGIALALGAALALAGGPSGIRWAFVLAGVWWLAFTVPVVRRVGEPPAVPAGPVWRRLRTTLGEARRHPRLWRFLLAYWLYTDGIGTIIKMAGAYGADLGIPLAHMLGAFLLTQAIGAPATVWFGRFGARRGAKAGILLALGGYVGITLLGVWMTSAWQFWVLAGAVGLVQGGAQALSRSLFARLVPVGREAELFSFYDISGRMAGVVGPVVFAVLTGLLGSPRWGVGAVLVLLAGGAWLLRGLEAGAGETTT